MKIEEFLERWQFVPETMLQLNLLRRIVSILHESPECIAAVLLGSFAGGKADRVSDLDLVLFSRGGSGQELLDRVRFLIEDADVFTEFVGSHGEDSPFSELIFYDFTSVEVHVIAPQTRFTIKQPYIEIINRHAHLESRLSDKPAPTRADLVPYRHGEDWLPWELFNCMKWLSRGETETAKKYLIRLGKAIEASGASDA